MKTERSIVFIVELLILFLIILTVIVMVTVISVKARGESADAAQLTEAVVCAENAAEITKTASDAEEAADKIRSMKVAEDVAVVGTTVSAKVALQGDSSKGRSYDLKILVEEEPGEAGTYVEEEIQVYPDGSEKPVYTLRTGNYEEAR